MRTVLITGSTDGIGLATAKQLLAQGHRVLIHGRDEAKAEAVAARLVGETVAVFGDLSELSQVRKLAEQVAAVTPVLDGLINNAAIFSKTRALSPDGFEMTMAVNHFAPFLLTHLLLPALKNSDDARVVNVSAALHARSRLDLSDIHFEKRYDGRLAYGASKLANVAFTLELARRTPNTQVTTAALHPGVISTKLLEQAFGMTGASVEEGARTSVFCATSATLRGNSGKYFVDSAESTPGALASDEAFGQSLWELSSRLVGA
jgi:NAD(P)-dependent dehydrogenase (short-subunit alcohol dehydrogenase family)